MAVYLCILISQMWAITGEFTKNKQCTTLSLAWGILALILVLIKII